MVVEAVVLLGIQHLKQSRRRIPSKIAGELVYLVQEKNRIRRACPLNALDNLSGHGPNIGPAMTANFGLIPHSPQRGAHKLSASRPGDGTSEGCLPNPRRPHETKNRSLELLNQLVNCEILQNALFGLLQPIMIIIENFLRLREVQIFGGAFIPRKIQAPIHIIANNRSLSAHGGHELKLLQLLLNLGPRFVGEVFLLEALFKLHHLGLVLVPLPQLFLNRPHLLVEVIFLLGTLHLLLNARPNFSFDREDFNLRLHQLIEPLKALARVGHLKHLLLIGMLDGQMSHDGIGQPAQVCDLPDIGQHVWLEALGHSHIAVKDLANRSHQALEFTLRASQLFI